MRKLLPTGKGRVRFKNPFILKVELFLVIPWYEEMPSSICRRVTLTWVDSFGLMWALEITYLAVLSVYFPRFLRIGVRS